MQTNQTSGREGQLLHRCHLQFVDFVGEYNSQCLTLLTDLTDHLTCVIHDSSAACVTVSNVTGC